MCSLCDVTDSHSQWIFATLIIGDTPFPEFSVVVMLDDIQMGFYDSDTGTMIYSQHRSEEGRVKEDEGSKLEILHRRMKDAAYFLKHQFNNTEGKCLSTFVCVLFVVCPCRTARNDTHLSRSCCQKGFSYTPWINTQVH